MSNKNTSKNRLVQRSIRQSTARSTNDKINAKKNVVLNHGGKNRLPIVAAVICLMMIAGGGVFYFQHKNAQNTVSNVKFSPDTLKTRITYPVDRFEDGKARHFEYRDKAITIKYFIIKSSDGIIRAAYDACDVCWPAGKGYYQSGDDMVCRNCGRRFKSVLVNEVKGGCNPAPLQRQVENGHVILNVADILDGKSYFDFSGKA